MRGTSNSTPPGIVRAAWPSFCHRDNRDRSGAWIVALCLIGGVLLAVIGIRYLLVPESAARTFGVPGRPDGYELYYIIGLRNVWLGLLAVAFAALREWRALALWFALGTIVCFADGVHCGKLDRPAAAGRVSRRLRLGLCRAGGWVLAAGETSELTR